MQRHPKYNDDYAYSLTIQVRDYEVDAEGIVNNANYLHYMEHTRHMFCRDAGLSFRQMHERGIDPVVRHADIEYCRSLGLGDIAVSKLNIRRDGPRFVFEQDIFDTEGNLIVCANITIVSIENGRLTRGDILAEYFDKYL